MSWRTWLSLLLTALPLAAEPAALFVTVGLGDDAPTTWAGNLAVRPGELTGIDGWLLSGGDVVAADGTFAIASDALPRPRNPTSPNGFVARVESPADATVELTVNGGTWSRPLREIPWGEAVLAFDGHISVERVPVDRMLQDLEREDDFPAACAVPDGGVAAVWQSWNEAEALDRIYVSRWHGGDWSTPESIPGVLGDVYQPRITPLRDGLLVAWSELIDGDFQLRAARFGDGGWQAPEVVCERPGHDTDIATATAPDGSVYAVWRGYRGGSADIFMSRLTDTWSAAEVVDGAVGNAWSPALAAGPSGVFAVWDSYEYGSYDVFAAPLTPEGPGPRFTVAATPKFEAWPSLAVAPDGAVWFAWQEAGEDWGKDSGTTVPKPLQKERLYTQRTVAVAAWRNGTWQAAPVPLEGQRYVESPRLTVDRGGRVWLSYRQPLTVPRQQGRKIRSERVWETYLTSLESDGWSPDRYFAARMARIDTWPALAPLADGVMVVHHTDGRDLPELRMPTRNRIFAAELHEEQPAPAPELTAREVTEPVLVNADEAAAVARCRGYVATVKGVPLRIVRGDTHRHTEVSWDGVSDGSIYDAYRYAMDAASLDYFVVTDHNQRTGVDLPYVRWRCYKLADVMHNPGVFTTYFGYERSLGFPNGHRNFLQAERGLPSLPMGQPAPDLTKLYEYARQTRSVVIAHTTGTDHGTDWYDYDRQSEPVVEIFQGCRLSYEYEGAPKGGEPGDAQSINTGYQPAGFVWRAWQKDVRVGVIASSDHGSTHYSYGMVYTPAKSREAILDAFRARHTYGATDNLIVDARWGDRFMGDEWRQAEPPTLDLTVVGTGELARVDIIKDYRYVYTTVPEGSTFETRWQDNQATPGAHLYYVRVQQDDTSIAWSSPVWIEQE